MIRSADTTTQSDSRTKDTDVLNALAAAYLAFGHCADAVHLIALSLRLDQHSSQTLELLACASYKLGDFRQTLEAAERIKRLGLAPAPEVKLCVQLAEIGMRRYS